MTVVHVHPPTDSVEGGSLSHRPARTLELTARAVLVDGEPFPWALRAEPIRVEYDTTAPDDEVWAVAYLPLWVMGRAGRAVVVGPGLTTTCDRHTASAQPGGWNDHGG